MIARYTRPEMGRIWSEENKYRQWLEVELAAGIPTRRPGSKPVEGKRGAETCLRNRLKLGASGFSRTQSGQWPLPGPPEPLEMERMKKSGSNGVDRMYIRQCGQEATEILASVNTMLLWPAPRKQQGCK